MTMKRLLLTAMLFVPIMAMAHIPEFTDLATKYQSTEDVTVVNLEGEMLMSAMQAHGDTEGLDSILDSMIVINSENSKVNPKIEKSTNKIIADLGLKSMLNLEQEGTIVNMYSQQNGDVISDLVIFVIEGDELALIILSGNFEQEHIGELTSGLGMM